MLELDKICVHKNLFIVIVGMTHAIDFAWSHFDTKRLFYRLASLIARLGELLFES
jgi:hypothetical protein